MFKEYKDYWLMILGIIALFGASLFITTYTKDNPQFVPDLLETIGTFIDSKKINEAPQIQIDKKTVYQADITTSLGVIRINLLTPYAIDNVNNFVFLAKQKLYESSRFTILDQNEGLITNITITNNAKINYKIKSEINWDSLKLSENERQILTKEGYESTTNIVTSPFKQYSIGLVQSDINYSKGAFFIITSDKNEIINKYTGKFTKIAEVVSGQDIVLKILSSLNDNKSTPIKITGVVVYE